MKGDGAAGTGLIFDSLMTGSGDEPDSLYGLVARAVGVSPHKTNYRFLEVPRWIGLDRARCRIFPEHSEN